MSIWIIIEVSLCFIFWHISRYKYKCQEIGNETKSLFMTPPISHELGRKWKKASHRIDIITNYYFVNYQISGIQEFNCEFCLKREWCQQGLTMNCHV